MIRADHVAARNGALNLKEKRRKIGGEQGVVLSYDRTSEFFRVSALRSMNERR